MARGKKTSEEIKEKIIAAHYAGESMGEIARMFKLGKSTVSGIIKRHESERPDEVEQIRMEKKLQFVEGTEGVLQELLGIFDRRVKNIAQNEDKLETIIKLISESDNMTQAGKTSLMVKMQGIMCPKLTEITTAFGTMYDKLERMKLDNPDENGGGVVELSSTVTINPPDSNSVIEEPENE